MSWSSQPWSAYGWGAKGSRVAFSPSQLPNLKLWVKSDTGITIVTGVSQWNDQSGNGNNLLQATGANQPVVTAAAINGLPAITFDGTNDFLKTAPFTLAAPCTVFLVASQPTWTSTDRVYDGNANDSMALQQATVTPNIRQVATLTGVGQNTNWATATFALVTTIWNGASSSMQVNSTTAVTSDPGASAAGGFTLGARSAGTFPANISVAEVIIMASVASASEIAMVKSYVTVRYGFAA
jgi:hypothetical protein